MHKFFVAYCSFTLCLLVATSPVFADPDTAYKQPVSLKYEMPPDLLKSKVKKVVIDYNNIVYVLAGAGVYRVDDRAVVKDLRYTPLANKVPVDIAVQEGTNALYYLYNNELLSNSLAGLPHQVLPSNKYSLLAVAASGAVFLSGNHTMALCQDNTVVEVNAPVDDVFYITAHLGVFYALSNHGVYELSGTQLRLLHKGQDLKAMCFYANEIFLATSKGFYAINKASGHTTLSIQTKVPVQNITCLAAIGNHVWAGTNDGAFMQENNGSYRYYASKRWLNEDSVISITSDSNGDGYLLTPTGLNKITFVSQTLAQKAAYFEDKIRQRHIRYGFISEVTFAEPGNIATAQMTDTDNDGLWSAFYLGSQAFRYAVTKDKIAKRYAWEAFEAYERLLSVNGMNGFPSRTFERKGFKYSDPERWHASPDSVWEWKGTTSSDEFVGYIFIASVLHEMVAETKEEKARVANFIDKILTHVIKNNYYFIDADGKPTMWGKWNPEYINAFPSTVGDRKLGSVTIIAGLQLGYALTRKEVYKNEALRLMNEHGYLKNILVSYKDIKPTSFLLPGGVEVGEDWNHSDDEMAFLSYWVLCKYSLTKQLQQQFATVVRDHWEMEKPERNALWNLISLGTSGAFDKESVLWHLQEFPMDLIRWNIRNAHRKDLVLLPPNFRGQSTEKVLSPEEAPVNRHNANAFELDGGDGGKTELAGDEFLLPYWMARYLKVLQ